MKIIAVLLFLFFATFTVLAKDFPEPSQIIKDEGKFIFTDGSSYYLFQKDGTFKSEPVGISGRVITGTWKSQNNLFVIQGKWSWVNGLSQENDFRKMVLYINNPASSEIVEKLSFGFGSQKVKIYKCYFLVEELQKIPKLQ
jgi:hypothetical protein